MESEAALKNHLLVLGGGEKPAAVEIKALEYVNVPRLTNIMVSVQATDPLYHYVDVRSTDAPFWWRQWIKRSIWYYNLVRKRRMFVIDRGDASIIYAPRGNPPAERGIYKIVEAIANFADRSLGRLDTKEMKKRWSELMDKEAAALQTAFGDSVNDMIEIMSLCTHPEKRNRGYGTALVKFITDIADTQGCSTWLMSSNILNTAFYESCGFRVVAEFPVGEANPTWKEPPVIVRIMVRKWEALDEKRIPL